MASVTGERQTVQRPAIQNGKCGIGKGTLLVGPKEELAQVIKSEKEQTDKVKEITKYAFLVVAQR